MEYADYSTDSAYIRLRKILSRAESHNITPGNNGPTFTLSNTPAVNLEMAFKYIEGRYLNSYWEVSQLEIHNGQYFLKLVSYNLAEITYITVEQFNDYYLQGNLSQSLLTDGYEERQKELEELQSKTLSEAELTTEKIMSGLCSGLELPRKIGGVDWLSSAGYYLSRKYRIIAVYAKGERLDGIYSTSSLQQMLLLCLDCGRIILRSVPFTRDVLIKDNTNGCGCLTEEYKNATTEMLNQTFQDFGNYKVIDIIPTDKGRSNEVTLHYKVKCEKCGKTAYVSSNSKTKFHKFCDCRPDTEVMATINYGKFTIPVTPFNYFNKDDKTVDVVIGDVYKTWRVEKEISKNIYRCTCLHCGGSLNIERDRLLDFYTLYPYSCGCISDSKTDIIKKYIRKLNEEEGKELSITEGEDIIITCNDKSISIGLGKTAINLPGLKPTTDYNITNEMLITKVNALGGNFTYIDAIQACIHEVLQIAGFTEYNEVLYLEDTDWRN